MSNYYAHRDNLKTALSIPTSATAAHDFLDTVLEGVSRTIDEYVNFHFYAASGTRYYRPRQSTYLDLDYPLVSIDSITLDTDGNASYESTLDSTGYYTTPYNATEESPKKPWWGIEIRSDADASAVFPITVARGAKIAGTWGYYNEREEASCIPATAIDATQTVIPFTNSTLLKPGMTIIIDTEQMFVKENGMSGSDTTTSSGTASGPVTVQRGVNGTTGTTHSSNSTVAVYAYPIVGQACLYQAEMDYRAKDAPMGIAAGGEPGGGQRITAPGGLHPFTRRMLDAFRVPVVR